MLWDLFKHIYNKISHAFCLTNKEEKCVNSNQFYDWYLLMVTTFLRPTKSHIDLSVNYCSTFFYCLVAFNYDIFGNRHYCHILLLNLLLKCQFITNFIFCPCMNFNNSTKKKKMFPRRFSVIYSKTLFLNPYLYHSPDSLQFLLYRLYRIL